MARDFYSQLGTSEYSIRNLICFKEPSQWHHVCFYKTVIYGRHFAHRSGKLRPGSFLRRSCGPLAPQPSPGSMIGKSYGNHGNQYIIGIRIIGYHIILIYNIMGNNIILIDYGNNIYIYIYMMGISLETIGVSQSAPTRIWFLELQKLQWQRLPFLRGLSPTGDHGISLYLWLVYRLGQGRPERLQASSAKK